MFVSELLRSLYCRYLKDNQAYHFHQALVDLGVEKIRDLYLVLPSDLHAIGMDEDTTRRVLQFTASKNKFTGSRRGDVEKQPFLTNNHRKHSIAKAIVGSLSAVELDMLKDYLLECAPDAGPAAGDGEADGSKAAPAHVHMLDVAPLNCYMT